MSHKRRSEITASPYRANPLALAIAVLVLGAVAAAQSGAPLLLQSEPGAVEKRARAITPENPIPRRVSWVAPVYPSEAEGTGAFGSVMVQLTLDEGGATAEVRPLGASIRVPGAPGGFAAQPLGTAFSRSAEQAVRQWVYDPPYQGPITFQVTFNFVAGSAEATMFTVQQGTPRPPLQVTTTPGLTVVGPGTPSSQPPIRVGGNIKPPIKTRDVKPLYPPIAQTARVSGVVIVETVIGTDGRVTNATIMRSIPLLDGAALEAVRQWEFGPTLLNGQPTPIVMSVTVNFQLD